MTAEPNRRETARIVDQLTRSYEARAWSGPSLKEVLEGITPELAARRPSNGAHSIWEIVRHISLWAGVCRRTLEGHPYPPRLTPPADWPAAEGTWPDAVAELDREQNGIIAALAAFDDARLDACVTEPKGYSYYVLLHGVVQHNLYHAGQIAILKR